jgi:AraC family chitin signaling transcriptional activator
MAKSKWNSVRTPFCLVLLNILALGAAIAGGDSLKINGIARVIHYTQKDFQGDPQFWTMCQDKAGVLYFGNNDGALIFDGQRWQKVRLPNNSSIRALTVSSDGIVYAGGFNEMGIIKKDAFGKYQYESLLNLLRPEDRNIENVWQIHEVEGHIVFRSYKMLIAVANNKAITLPTSTVYDLSFVLNNKLYVNDREGLKSLDLNSLVFTNVYHGLFFNRESLLTLLPGIEEGEFFALTREGSLFKADPEKGTATLWQRLLPENSNNLLTCAIKASSGNYYIGTLRTKVISLNASGKQINTSQDFDNLQDNSVHSLFESHEGNIWAMLNNGIDCIDVMSPVSQIFEDASIYDATVHQNRLVLATNQGVFISNSVNGTTTLTKQNFTNVNGLEGQAWTLQQFEGRLLVSHDKGVFVLGDKGFKRVENLPGGIWKVIAVKSKPGYYLACAYDGLFLMTYDKSRGFELKHKLEGFIESSRDILEDDEPGVFWVCHGYKGVFRIRIDDAFKRVVSLEHFRDKNGFLSPFNINVARWQNQIIFTTNHGIYTYREKENKFVQHEFLTKLFGTELNVRKIIEYGDKTWFAHDDEVGYFFTNSKNPKLEKDLFLQLKGSFNQSMECIVPLSSQNILIGTITGLYAFDLDYNPEAREMQTVITSASYNESSGESFVPLALGTGAFIKLPFNTSGILFNFAAPAFQNKMNVQYSYMLEGVDNDWSEWNESAAKEYSLLRPGKYSFRVKSRSLLGERGSEAVYNFQILPAWYQSIWAVIGYCIGSAILIALIVTWVKRRISFEKEKTLNEEMEKRRVLELEIERMKLAGEKARILKDKEQLEEDVIYKSKELVNYTMLLVKKRELLTEMHDDLKVLKELVKNDASRQTVRDLLKKINSNLESEEHIKVFEANFERVHHEFFAQLKNNFQDLTQKELQLCAFVRMNLTNKEIASILNISVRGIETARYRLRKRLGMSHEEDMAEFLEKLHSSHDDSSPEVAQMSDIPK